MKRLISITMALTVTIITTFSGVVTVHAEEENVEMTQEVFTVGMALPFQMLEAYLYALTGQQAVDTYYNNEEQEKELHEDFCNFLGDTSTGIQMNMQINKALATVTMDKMMEYYKTEGSSALSGASEKARENFKVIVGGGNNDNNDNDDNDPEYEETVRLMSSSSSALVTIVAKYIDELVNGNRGNVSKTFAGSPQYCFNGDYTVIDGILYYDYWGDGLLTHRNAAEMSVVENYTQIGAKNLLNLSGQEVTRQSILIHPETQYKWHNGTWVIPYFHGLVNGKMKYIASGNNNIFYNGIDIKETSYNGLYFASDSYMNISGIPVFVSSEAMEYYLQTGDASGAINYFDGSVNKPGWYSFPFSSISSKLNKLLQPFNTLPLITTESLTGFAQGVNNSAVAGALPSANPEQQQSQLEKLLEDNAKRAVTEQLADNAVTKTENELAEEYGATPQPTLTPEQNVVVTQSQIMVDLHNFFPFCVPYDLVHLIKALNAPPVAPCFETAIVYDPLGIDVPIKLDLSGFEGVAKVFRITEVILFILALILVSRALIRG